MDFPDEGCKEAFACGQEFYLSGVSKTLLPEALEFCDTHQERLFFLMGVIMEIIDKETTAA